MPLGHCARYLTVTGWRAAPRRIGRRRSAPRPRARRCRPSATEPSGIRPDRSKPRTIGRTPSCSALTRPAPCVPTTPDRPSPSLAGWRDGAITVASPSSTCGMPRGVAQVVARDEVLEQGGAHDVRNEYCVKVTGEVRSPSGGQRQPRPAHRRDRGHRRTSSRCSTRAAPLPFQIDERVTVGEEARLKHRYLDLRRPGASSAGAAIRLRTRSTPPPARCSAPATSSRSRPRR